MANREALLISLEKSPARRSESGVWLTLMLIDLDGPTHMNSCSGHRVSDAVLGTLRKRLQATVALRISFYRCSLFLLYAWLNDSDADLGVLVVHGRVQRTSPLDGPRCRGANRVDRQCWPSRGLFAATTLREVRRIRRNIVDQLGMLKVAVDELRQVVVGLDDSEMDVVSNCEPWTIRQLASHAANAQLLWVGIVTGVEIVSVETVMGAVPYSGDLSSIVSDAGEQAVAAWSADGVLEGVQTTPFGDLVGSAAIPFPIIDALSHAWDIGVTLGRSVEFAPEIISGMAAVVASACTDGSRGMGLFGIPTEPPANATETERLMAATGRMVPR